MPAQAQVTGIVDSAGVRMRTVGNVGDTLLLPWPPQIHLGAEGVRPRGLGRDLYMGESRRRSLGNQPSSEAEGRSERELSGDPRGLQSSVYESRRVTDPEHQDPDNAELGPEDPEEELPPEEVAGEELSETLDPKEALSELERVLDKDLEEDIPEIRWAPRSGPAWARWGRAQPLAAGGGQQPPGCRPLGVRKGCSRPLAWLAEGPRLPSQPRCGPGQLVASTPHWALRQTPAHAPLASGRRWSKQR